MCIWRGVGFVDVASAHLCLSAWRCAVTCASTRHTQPARARACVQITPGTLFSSDLNAIIRYWAVHRLATNAAFANVHIVVSDTSVPGEGEVKALRYAHHLSRCSAEFRNESFVVVSDDSDMTVMLLGLPFMHGGMWVYSTRMPGAPELFSLAALERALATMFPEASRESLRDDFVAIFLLCQGNGAYS